MRLRAIFNFNSILILLLGAGCVLGGIMVYRSEKEIIGIGLFLTGIGNFMLGLTNGFNDTSPTGRHLFRIGMLAYAFGIPLIAYETFTILSPGSLK